MQTTPAPNLKVIYCTVHTYPRSKNCTGYSHEKKLVRLSL
jgi:hypothetical protein